jgi:separase
MIQRSYHEESDLFIYCGHGAGEKMEDTSQLKKFSHCPSALLWGCSSGRLTPQGVFDPSGPALNYLLAGAPFVVGNLWDVTDKDIDKLSLECMRLLLDEEENVASALASSRKVCKLKFAVGCAPVVYGIPIKFSYL